ncbi:helix-turn-helix domain-containing protein [Streptomyces sp. NPDC058086]|uniref:helix-turn-helix domain-containing protein n=1 Tax=Streptomyces sp. NPDC058086 TaxID=3346334 RepID=UPI0036EE02EA
MTSHSDPRVLGAFLRAHGAQLDPRECGLIKTDSTRRVAGLRRKEVARLAAISVDCYSRLEQGRVRASAPVLTTLARALRLDDDQQQYLYELADRTDARTRRRRPTQRVRPAMRRLLEQLTHAPALILGKRLDILAWNPQDWEHDARDAVAALRMEAAADPDLARLVGELTIQDTDFRTWWAERRVNNATYATKHYRHPLVGDLTLDCDTWADSDGSGQRLIVLTAQPDSPSHDALRMLASWTAERAEPGRAKGRAP